MSFGVELLLFHPQPGLLLDPLLDLPQLVFVLFLFYLLPPVKIYNVLRSEFSLLLLVHDCFRTLIENICVLSEVCAGERAELSCSHCSVGIRGIG